MAVTNLKQMEGTIANHPRMIGTGTPADSDLLSTDTAKYPVGSSYLDTTAGKIYYRIDDDGDKGDWAAATLTPVS